eukprot:381505-Hanusia_phi.AAC.1
MHQQWEGGGREGGGRKQDTRAAPYGAVSVDGMNGVVGWEGEARGVNRRKRIGEAGRSEEEREK